MEAEYKQTDVSKKIVELSLRLFQQGGYKSFSYRDLAKEIGIKTSSIHYYFPAKDDLAKALIKQYREESKKYREDILKRSKDPKVRLELYMEYYMDSFVKKEILGFCTMLCSDMPNLTENVNLDVQNLYKDNISWITAILEDGIRKKVFQFYQSPAELAQVIFSCLEGAAVASRISGDDEAARNTCNLIKNILEPKEKGFISKYLSINR